jgi:hypothetical protein
MRGQHVEVFGRDGSHLSPVEARSLRYKVVEEQWNIVPPLRQWGNYNLRDRKSIVEIGAEIALPSCLAEINLCRCQDPHIDWNCTI